MVSYLLACLSLLVGLVLYFLFQFRFSQQFGDLLRFIEEAPYYIK